MQSLAAEGSALAKSYRDLSERMLRFAQHVGALSERAYELDDGDTGKHHKHLRVALAKAVGTENQSVVSKWITIGSQVDTLLPYRKSLPPQRECLYELARAAEGDKPIQKWIDDKRLTIDSTVREVMLLTKKKKSRKPRQKEYLAAITLSFQTYEAAATVLKELVLSEHHFKISAHNAFADALKSDIRDEQKYEKVAARFI